MYKVHCVPLGKRMEAAPTVAGELFRFSINKKYEWSNWLINCAINIAWPHEEYAILLTCQDADTLMYLQQQAQEVTLAHFGNAIFIRGLIEVGNRCRNNCYYCGIRKGNPAVARYALKRETILECCCEGYALGFRTFVMQGGEDPALTDEWIEATVAAIRNEFSDCAITLSLGRNHGSIRAFFPGRSEPIPASARNT